MISQFPALADVPYLPCLDGLLSLWNHTPSTSHLNQLFLSRLWSQYLSWIASVGHMEEGTSNKGTYLHQVYLQTSPHGFFLMVNGFWWGAHGGRCLPWTGGPERDEKGGGMSTCEQHSSMVSSSVP